MKKNCLIIGGGFAGLNAAISLEKELNSEYQIILMDKNDYHLRRVLLFKEAADGKELKIPFRELLPETVKFIQGDLYDVQKCNRKVDYHDQNSKLRSIEYDKLILALGSVCKTISSEFGGIALTDIDAAHKIKKTWQANFREAKKTVDLKRRKALLSVAVVGAGITGIETATELTHSMREYAQKLELDLNLVSTYLINSKADIFEQGTSRTRHKIRQEIEKCGITILDGRRGGHFRNNSLRLDKNGEEEKLSVGTVVWTLGVSINPIINNLDIPLTTKGKIVVDKSYHVEKDIYSIGDCAHIVDFKTGKIDGMTCKEAVPQAHRLAKVLKAEIKHKKLPEHKSYTSLFCISMGPNNGIFWMKIGRRELLLRKRLGWLMRAYTWNLVSLQKGIRIT
ncbi:NAD(P)/FAD-dependent oxidoreductase [Enterococcus faecalis]|uniref:NAD(P)/FAD-dependent oxidoreductase n=1 Tax=Enterococcus faecalis TaxID=1351 RepID=UPI00287FB377|nr:FAD-dependent oxidoreductase [Enterococcus faecalis]